MRSKKLARLVAHNARRNWRQFLLSAFGIVVGIAAFVFVLALSMAARSVFLGKIAPLEKVEVVAPRASMLGMDTTAKLTDETVQALRARPEVEQAVPRMALAFPATGVGYFEGQKLNFEVGGFADGIAPVFLEGEDFSDLFKDWEQAEEHGGGGSCGPPKFSCPDPGRYYCDRQDMTCRHRVPVVVSRTLLELYNGQFATSHGLPVIGKDLEKFIVSRGGLGAMKLYIGLGDTMVAGSNQNLDAPPRRVQAVLIGISDKAMPIGMTVPIGYVERWNREFVGEEAASTYSSIEVTLRGEDDVAPFSAWLREDMDLRLEDQQGERFATAIFVVTLLFVLISLVIVTISAINIAHNFFMQVSERRREIGILRAVGATQADVRRIILGEATLIGAIGGVAGIALAWACAFAADLAAARLLPSFPFKPESFFLFEWWILGLALLVSLVFCSLGGYFPARRAARMEPAQALAQQ